MGTQKDRYYFDRDGFTGSYLHVDVTAKSIKPGSLFEKGVKCKVLSYNSTVN